MLRNYQLLIIDDDSARRKKIEVILDFLGEPVIQSNSDEWQKASCPPEKLLAIMVGDVTKSHALETLLATLNSWAPHVPLILLTEEETHKTLPKPLRYQCAGTLNAPYQYANVMALLHQCQAVQENNTAVNNQGKNRPVPLFRSLVGTSQPIQHIRHLISQVAPTDANVLILGESGTGKEVAARNIHAQSARRDAPFIPINCGAIPGELLESELFGHEKGAFTGAIAARQGRFEMANGGTLFLDEIGDMPLIMQVKLLRVLQERCFERVGSNRSIDTDVRIIAATHRHLETEIEKGNFREDLFYRLNVFPIQLVPLRERIEDLPLLVNELIARMDGEKRGQLHLLPRAITQLCRYPWPGNIRELANLMERLAILYPNGVVDKDDLPKKFCADETAPELEGLSPETTAKGTAFSPLIPSDGIDLKEYLVRTECALIQQALEESNWVVARAATYLNMRRTTLVEKMRKYDIARPQQSDENVCAEDNEEQM